MTVTRQTRRRLLKLALSAVPGALLFRNALADASAESARTLTLTSTHTGESLTARYFAAGGYVAAVLAKLNQVLRDHRTGDVGAMDPALFDFLHEVALRAAAEPHFEVISGYRSVASNAMLRQRSPGVSEKSLHMLGKAIDVRLRGVETARLRDVALALRRGGVGYYAKSDFLHLDTGRVRSWSG